MDKYLIYPLLFINYWCPLPI